MKNLLLITSALLLFIFSKGAYAIYPIYACYTTIVSSSDGGSWDARTTCDIIGYRGSIPPEANYEPYGSAGYRQIEDIGRIYLTGYYNTRMSEAEAKEYCHESNEILSDRCHQWVEVGVVTFGVGCASLSEGLATTLCMMGAGMGLFEGKEQCNDRKQQRTKVCNDLEDLNG